MLDPGLDWKSVLGFEKGHCVALSDGSGELFLMTDFWIEVGRLKCVNGRSKATRLRKSRLKIMRACGFFKKIILRDERQKSVFIQSFTWTVCKLHLRKLHVQRGKDQKSQCSYPISRLDDASLHLESIGEVYKAKFDDETSHVTNPRQVVDDRGLDWIEGKKSGME